jgi:hypothetical protein
MRYCPEANSVEGNCDEVAADVGDMKKATRVGGCFSLAAAPVFEGTGIGHQAAGNSVKTENRDRLVVTDYPPV